MVLLSFCPSLRATGELVIQGPPDLPCHPTGFKLVPSPASAGSTEGFFLYIHCGKLLVPGGKAHNIAGAVVWYPRVFDS